MVIGCRSSIIKVRMRFLIALCITLTRDHLQYLKTGDLRFFSPEPDFYISFIFHLYNYLP
jgi:hypothetical protein